DEYAGCFAQGPAGACQFGATTLEGTPISGEYFCIESCIWNVEGVGDQPAIDACVARCGSAECDATTAGEVATALAQCTVVGDGAGDDCYPVCFPGL
ncbi:MAG TPA: hypothetical protein VLC09_11745, partial [Polyangiaceae bacterium]|nr:hypothetical protein [Polyangiaceae bacterium]